jgi:hypothetical protein
MYFDIESNAFKYQLLPRGASDVGVTYCWYTEPFPAPEPTGVFNFNDPNDGLVYMGEQEGIHGQPWSILGYAILKQADGNFKYIEFETQRTMAEMVAANNKKRVSIFSAGSGIGHAKFFARAPLNRALEQGPPFLYYVTNDNKVYKADISGASAVVTDITSSILTDDGYTEITAFKYVLPNADDIGKPGRTLAIATYNPSLGKDAGGKLAFFKIEDPSSGSLALAKYPENVSEEGAYQIDMSWTGLGKIVGLTYKQK